MLTVRNVWQETCCCTQCIEKGAAAFELLEDIIKQTYGLSAEASKRREVAKNIEVYYERYYRGLMLPTSQDVHRCMTHALSHPTDKDFQSTCSHQHIVQCEIMQQDVAYVQELRMDIQGRVDTLSTDDRDHLKWQLQTFEEMLSKYKAHLVRKSWDREAYKRLIQRMSTVCALVIIDYGQKVEPCRNRESQSEHFGKAGISQFGSTYLMRADGFEADELVTMLGDQRAAKLKPGDLVAFTVVFYNSDANQVRSG